MKRFQKKFWQTALCLMLALLPALCAHSTALDEMTSSVDMWVHTSSLTVNMDTVVTHERTPPYRVLYFMAGGTVYDSSGSFNTFETRMSDSFAGYVVDGAYYYEALGNGKGVLHQGWDGGYTESNFDRWMNAGLGTGTDFSMELSASADAFVTGEEIFLKGDVVSLSGSHPPYEPYFHIFTAPNTSDIKPSLDSGLPDTLIFKEPGTYYVFGTVVDGRKGRSMFDGMTLTIAQGPETTAKITDFDRVHTHIAEGDMLDWTLKADPGAGDLQQIVYLYKDGEFLSRHVIDGLEGAIPIQERGTYSMRIRLKDLANNAYSPFYSTGNMTVHPLYSYNVLNEGKENESIELTYYNSYNPVVALPDTFDGYPVTAVKDYLLNYIDDTITSLTWTPAVPTVPGSIANGCPLLETVILPDGVKAIGNGAANYGAFSGCTSLKNVTLPDSLTTIGTYAFQSCSALESFTIGKNVESLGNHVFDNCTALKEIIFGEKLKAIGDYAFQNSGLETLVLPEGVTTVGTYAFNQAPISRLELPDSVTAVGERTFEGIESTLTYLRWPGGVETIPGGTFYKCTKLETVVLGEGVTAIADAKYGSPYQGAFDGCTSLKNVTLPETLVSIGHEAFQSCTALETFTISKNVESLGNYVFDGCKLLKEITFGEKLKTIGDYAFQSTALETLVLPEGVLTVGTYAFNQAPVSRLELPDSVTAVGERTFEGIEPTLTYVRWPGGVATVPGGTFYNCTKLETAVLGEGVTAIGDAVYTSPSLGAFDSCTSLKNVTLPDTLVSIGRDTFQNCTALETITLGKNVETLCNYVFDGCTALKEITFGEKLKTIGGYAFQNCKLLTKIVVPDGLTSIGNDAFAYSGVTHLELPDSVTTIDERTFDYIDTTLTYLRWPGGVTTVPGGMFCNYKKLETVVLGEGVTAIGDAEFNNNTYGAFETCISLKNVSLPETLTAIGSEAFQGCTELETFTISKNVESLGSSVFEGCTALKEITFGEKLQTIGSYAFQNCTLLTTMVVPDGLTTIGRDAFARSGVSRLELPDSVTTIDEYTFDYLTTTLTYLRWPGGVATVPGGTFYNCTKLETVVLGEGVTAIGNAKFNNNTYGAFETCISLKNVSLPETLTAIGSEAFQGCTALETFTISKNVESLGSSVFEGCTALKEITFGEKLQTIGSYAFQNCTLLTTMVVPDGLTTIGRDAFARSGVSRLELPDSVTTIDEYTFDYLTTTLTYLRWPGGVTTVPGGMFDGYSLLETVILPEGVTEIAYSSYGAFENCDALTSITLPDSLKTVGRNAFSSCDELQSVTLGKGTETIGRNAFNSCKALTTITFSDSLKTIGYGAFQSTALTSLSLPNGLTTVEGYAFASTKLESISFPDSVTSLASDALNNTYATLKYLRWPGGVATVPGGMFDGYSLLETVILPEGVTEIAYSSYGAFENCDALTSITLPASLKTIGKKSFYGCKALTTITFGDSLQTIGYGAFQSTALTSLSLPNGLTTVEGYAFASTKLESISFPDSVTTLESTALNNTKATLKYLRWPGGVTTVPGGMFNGYSLLETVILPEGVTELAYSTSSYKGAFYDCDALTSITLPASLKTIGQESFYGCDALLSVTLGKGTETIGRNAFNGCKALTTITFGDSLKTIGYGAFQSTALTSLSLPNGLTTVEGYAFASTKLESISFPDSVTSLASNALNSTKATLKHVRWPGGVPVVPGNMFYNCDVLETVILPEGVTEIAYSSYGAFQSCDALVYVSLPSTLKTLGTNAFYSCKLEKVYLPCNITSAAKRCFDSSVSLYCAPSSPTVASLSAAGFTVNAPSRCFQLPEAITDVQQEAFLSSGAELVILPEGCLSIGEKAFSGMPNLLYVVLPESLASIAEDAFENTQLLGVVAPEGSYAQQYLTDSRLPFAPQQDDT